MALSKQIVKIPPRCRMQHSNHEELEMLMPFLQLVLYFPHTWCSMPHVTSECWWAERFLAIAYLVESGILGKFCWTPFSHSICAIFMGIRPLERESSHGCCLSMASGVSLWTPQLQVAWLSILLWICLPLSTCSLPDTRLRKSTCQLPLATIEHSRQQSFSLPVWPLGFFILTISREKSLSISYLFHLTRNILVHSHRSSRKPWSLMKSCSF